MSRRAGDHAAGPTAKHRIADRAKAMDDAWAAQAPEDYSDVETFACFHFVEPGHADRNEDDLPL